MLEARFNFVNACLEGSADQQAWYEELQRVCARTVGKMAVESDQSSAYPVESIAALKEIGTLGVFVDKAFGGLGFSRNMALLTIETIASYCASTAAIVLFHFQVVDRTLRFAHCSFRDEDLRKLATGEWLGASAWSEPDAGADKKNLRSYAEFSRTGLKLYGVKSYCTGLRGAQLIHVLTPIIGPNGEKLTSFVRMTTCDPNFKIVDLTPMVGLRGTTTGSFLMDGIEVGETAVLGGTGAASALMKANQENGLNPGLLSLGISHQLIQVLREYTSPRGKGFAKRDFDQVRQVMAQCVIGTESLYRYLSGILSQVESHSRALDFMKFKAFATATAQDLSLSVLRNFGAAGLSSGVALERLSRDALTATLMGPTNELVYGRVFEDSFSLGE